jgi:hypothetical protein
MDLFQLITDRVQSTDDAKAFFGLKTKPTQAWLNKIEPGVNAAQRVYDHVVGTQIKPADPVPAAEEKFDPNAADFGLEPESGTPKAKAPAPAPEIPPPDVEAILEQLRPKLRLNGSSDTRAILEAVLGGKWHRKTMMLTPLATQILPWVHFAHMAQLRTQPWLGYHQETDTLIQKARNKCAQAFLASEAEWSWWVDGDIVPSWGDPAFFYDVNRLGVPQNRISADFLQKKTLDRLLQHGKSIVGGVYQQRRKLGLICSPADMRPHPRMDEKEAVVSMRQRGPKDKLLEVDWCATGCLLVHRQVYLDIMKKRPDLAPENPNAPWNLFGHEVGRGGEDAAFGTLAKECGHQSYLDLGAWVAHVGNYAYMPEPI